MDAILYLALASCLILGTSATFTMEITPTLASVGDEVTFKCHVISEDPRVEFEWFRVGADGAHEIIGINRLFTNPYLETRAEGPFTISRDYEAEGDTTIFTMTSSAIQIEDNARYGCDRITSRDFDLAAKLEVTRVPEEIFMYSGSTSLSPASIANMDPRAYNELLHITPTSSGHFMCAAEGFIPEPEVTMTFNGQPLTNFNKEVTSSTEASEVHDAYKYEVHNVYLTSTSKLQMEASFNRQPLTCTATVGDRSVSTMVRPVLRVGPQINCTDVKTVNGAKNVSLACIVEADPDCEVLVWTWTASGKLRKLDAGAKMDAKYKSHKIVMEDGRLLVSMHFDHVFPEMFRNYTLYGQNEIAETTRVVNLIRDIDNEKPNSSNTLLPGFCVLVSIVLAACRLL